MIDTNNPPLCVCVTWPLTRGRLQPRRIEHGGQPGGLQNQCRAVPERNTVCCRTAGESRPRPGEGGSWTAATRCQDAMDGAACSEWDEHSASRLPIGPYILAITMMGKSEQGQAQKTCCCRLPMDQEYRPGVDDAGSRNEAQWRVLSENLPYAVRMACQKKALKSSDWL
ncbi:hypothetical protein LY78DRAFT_651586 [Colletotrichum sublineola]|nr:hypothetical protein LY78DRAFT_651586 [Colletotrichum sublineola]